ncbi:tetratricopeptide repeat protein [Streptomyces lydicus]|uniref:tetratricopeptide repeat protein n=1 Tax=Streptomyces lydicus TaxID=47763 RepID=UPI00379FE057
MPGGEGARGQAGTWDTLGYAYHHLGDHPKAVDCYRRSLRLNRVLGHRYNEAETLVHLSHTHRATGAIGAARETLRQALALYREIQAPDAEVEQVRALLAELPQSARSAVPRSGP